MRYAVYLAPATDSCWWQAGCSWLGHDAARDVAVMQTLLPGISAERLALLPGISAERLALLTRTAARYGWHATLKAPFAPAAGVSEAMLLQQLLALAQRFQPFSLHLQPALLGDFLALRPSAPCAMLDELASSCVVALDGLVDQQQALRPRPGLSERQQQLQQRWGYPYVFEQYRCHFTLSDTLADAGEAQLLLQAAERHFAGLPPLLVDRLALFVEPQPAAPMRYLASCTFAGALLHVG